MVATVSIITVVRNNESGLARTFESVLSQTYVDWELLIIVGPSDDGTAQFALALTQLDSRIRAYIQNGIGIYSAMNNGLKEAKGEYVWFLNSGDEFEDRSTLSYSIERVKLFGADLILGGYSVIEGGSTKQYSKRAKRINKFEFAFNRRGGCHQSMIFRKDRVMDFGGFNLNYQLTSDFDLVLKVIEGGNSFRTEKVLARIDPGGISDQRIYHVIKEKHLLRGMHFPGNIPVYFISYIWGISVRTKIKIRRFLSSINN